MRMSMLRSMRLMSTFCLTKKSSLRSQEGTDRLMCMLYLLQVKARRLLSVRETMLKDIDDQHKRYHRLLEKELLRGSFLRLVATSSVQHMKLMLGVLSFKRQHCKRQGEKQHSSSMM